MKKIKKLLLSLILMFVFNINVFAASSSLSVSSGSVSVGDKFTVTAKISSAAAWNIHVSASGPVSGCVINQADTTADAMDTNKSFSATCTATGEGTINIKLSGDVTSATDGIAVNVSGNKNVIVSKKTTQSSNNNNNSPSNNIDNKSTNNNLKSLTIEGYELEKIDNNNYALIVANNVTSINVNAIAEDTKAKISGTGVKELQVGENNIEVIITSESGIQNKINIKVTKKDGYYLEDLDLILENDSIKDADVIITKDSKITKEDINKIKESKKILRLNYYDKDKKLVYSWIIDGNEIKDSMEFITEINFMPENKKEIYEMSNYADGLYIDFKYTGDLPNGTKIKIYVGDKFEEESIVNLYQYDKDKKSLAITNNELKVIAGYIEFDLEQTSPYFITMSVIDNTSDKVEESSINIFMIFTIIELIIILVLVLFIFIKFRTIKKKDNIF